MVADDDDNDDDNDDDIANEYDHADGDIYQKHNNDLNKTIRSEASTTTELDIDILVIDQ